MIATTTEPQAYRTSQPSPAAAVLPSGAEVVVQTLVKHGVSDVFGYPGGAIMPIYDALYQSPLKHYLCRHEQGAGFAAIGYARASNKLGVVFATSGPGATNLVTALADAMMDSIPMLAITGQVPRAAIGSDAFQEIDVLGMSLSVTKHSFIVRKPEELASTLQQAIFLAQSGRPGPVLVDIPKDIQQMPVQFKPWVAPSHSLPCLNMSDVAKANELLAQARKPLLYVGGGVSLADAQPELLALLAQCQWPAVMTLKGLGAVPADYPYNLGMLGMHGNAAANLAVQECDLLLAIGARFDDRVTGKLNAFAPNAKIVQLDIDPCEISKRKPVTAAIAAELSQSLPELLAPQAEASWLAHCLALKQQHAWQYDAPTQGGIYAPAVLRAVSAAMKDDTVVTCDVGQHQMWVAQHMQFSRPENHLSSGGLGTMGFGLPAAIGAQLARPQDTVICVSGDGSFMMNVQELASIRRFNLPVKVLLIDNQRLGMVRQWQQLFFAERYSETDLSDNPDFVALAAVFGIPGQYIDRAEQVDGAIADMLAATGPYFLQVRIDELTNVWPLVPPGAANHEMITEVQS